MEGPISFWGYKEQESNLILPEHDDKKCEKQEWKDYALLSCDVVYPGGQIFVYKCTQRQMAEGNTTDTKAAKTSDPSGMQVT